MFYSLEGGGVRKSLLFSCSSGIDSDGDWVGVVEGEDVDGSVGAPVGSSVGELVGESEGSSVRGDMVGVAVVFLVGGPPVNAAGDTVIGWMGLGVGKGALAVGATVGGGIRGSSHKNSSSSSCSALSPMSLLLSNGPETSTSISPLSLLLSNGTETSRSLSSKSLLLST